VNAELLSYDRSGGRLHCPFRLAGAKAGFAYPRKAEEEDVYDRAAAKAPKLASDRKQYRLLPFAMPVGRSFLLRLRL